MPRKNQLKCYFGCVIDGPLHHFPKPEWPHTEKFNIWKAVLDQSTQEKGDNYIHNQVRLCYRHFEQYYRLPSRLLTKNAIPTLNLRSSLQTYVAESAMMPEIIEIPTTSSTSQELQPTERPLLVNTVDNSTIIPQIPPIAGTSQDSSLRTSYKPDRKIGVNNYRKKGLCTYENKDAMKFTKKLLKLRAKCKTQTKRIKMAEKLAYRNNILKECDNISKSAEIIIKMQMNNKNKPRGRRYTLKEKIVSLTILKQSPKAYNFLKSIFTLPSKRTLQKVLKLLVIKPGINQELFDNIKLAVSKFSLEKKLVVLMFDEVSLAPGLYYNKQHEIVGFEDFGTKKTQNFADHALVFMIKGLKSKYKLPIWFSFCKSSTKKIDLKNIIKSLVTKISSTGLIVVATVCDQSPINIATINSLKEESKAEYLKKGKDYKSEAINIDGNIIYPLYDPPHLLKGIRNNLLQKNLRYIQNNEVKMAKWEHLQLLLKEDTGSDEIRLVNKLTEAHVYKERIPKMKVKHAAQVFSQRVSSAMRFLARHRILPTECEQTAEVLLLFDKIFDSFNGCSYKDSSKVYKGCLKNGSPHFKLWDDVIPILKSMGFEVNKKNSDGTVTKKYVKVPSLNNFIHNMKTVKEMWQYLKIKYNVNSILMRNLNQDPLENFFCQIRSNGIRNTNPTTYQFTNAYKTLLINNFTSPHSVNANCEVDHNKSLKLIKLLFKDKDTVQDQLQNTIEIDFDLIDVGGEYQSPESSLLHTEAKSYVSGYVAKKCRLKIFKKCDTCNMFVFSQNDHYDNNFIAEIDYTKKSLYYPSADFKKIMNEIYNITVTCLRKIPQECNLPQKIALYIDLNCNFNIFKCPDHKSELIEYIIKLAINIIIHSWCKGVNSILSGKQHRFDSNDPIKTAASLYYNKCRNRKKF